MAIPITIEIIMREKEMKRETLLCRVCGNHYTEIQIECNLDQMRKNLLHLSPRYVHIHSLA